MADNTFVNGYGQLEELAPEDVPYASQMGYIRATPQQIADHEKEERYGSTSQILKTAGEGAAQALSLGLSTHVEKLLGVKPEDIRARAEVNPLAHGVGEGLGVVAPLILSGGATAPEAAGELGAMGVARSAAELTAPSLIARAGRAATGLVEGLPEATGLAGQIAKRAAELGLGSAVEGSLYGLGNVVSEEALGDPHFSAQAAIAQIGLSGLLGGALGGTLGAAEIGLPKALQAAQQAAGGLARKASGAVEELYPSIASRLTGRTEEEISYILSQRGETLADPKYRAKFGETLADGLQDLHKANQDVKKQLFEQIKPAEMEKRLAGVDPGVAKAEAQRIANDLGAKANEFRSTPELRGQSSAAKLENLRDGLVRDLGKDDVSAYDVFKRLEETKSQLFDLGKLSPTGDFVHRETALEVKGLWKDLQKGLENEKVWGDAGAAQARLNSAYNELTQNEKMLAAFGKKIPTKSGGKELVIDAGKVNSFLSNQNTPAGMAKGEILDNWTNASKNFHAAVDESHQFAATGDFAKADLENLINKTGDQVAKARKEASLAQSFASGEHSGLSPTMESVMGAAALGHMVPGVGHAIGAALGPAHFILDFAKNPGRVAEVLAKLERFAQATDQGITKGAEDLISGAVSKVKPGRAAAQITKANFAEETERLKSLASNPTAMQDTLTSATQYMQAHAPNTTQALHIATSGAVAFLASKVPSPVGIQAPRARPHEPSGAEISTFNKYRSAVYNPLSLLDDARSGHVSKESLETLETVYPQLLQKIRLGITDKLTDHPGPIPYQRMLVLSAIMGQDLTGDTQGLLANQAAGAGDKARSGGGQDVAKPSGKPKIIRLGARALTPFQSASTRETRDI